MCAGPDFRGSFQRCTFNACTLYLVHGAAVALSDCAWRGCRAALIAHGLLTTATLTGCSFHACRFCVIAEAGASAALWSSELHGVTSTAVIANDPGSRISADGCTVTGSAGSPFATEESTWLRMHGGTARLRRCHIADFPHTAIAAGASASLELCATSIRCAEACSLEDGARGALSGVHFCGQGPPGAIAVRLECEPPEGCQPDSRAAARLQMMRCDAQSPDGVAVRVGEGSAAALLLCRLRCSRCVVMHGCGSRAAVSHCDARGEDICCYVSSPLAALRVQGGQVAAAGAAVVAIEKATVAAAGACFRGGMLPKLGGTRPDAAVNILDGASGRFLRCTIPEGFMGIFVNRGQVWAKESRVANMNAMLPARDQQCHPASRPHVADPPAAYVCTGGRLDVEGGSIENCMIGVITAPVRGVTGPLAELRMHEVVLKRYSRAVQVHDAARADIVECRFEGHAGIRPTSRASLTAHNPDLMVAGVEGGIALRGVQTAVVRGCAFRGHGQDIFVQCDVSVRIEECSFEGAPSGGRESCVKTFGDTAVEGCRFADAMCAVFADGPAASCMLRRCTVGGGVQQAFSVSGGASMSVIHCEVHATTQGLVVTGGGKLAVQDCECTAAMTALLVGEGGGVLTAKRVKAHGGGLGAAACAAGNGELKLVSCDLSGPQRGVQVAGAGNKASLLRCTVTADQVGVAVHNGAAAKVRDSQISRCHMGVKAGEFPCDFEGPCGFCGRGGPAALQHAWDTLLERGATRGRGARCVHEGAQTRVTLEAVQLHDCGDMGAFVSKYALLSAHLVDVSGCPLGFHVERAVSAERSDFADCKVVGASGVVGTCGILCHGPNEGDRLEYEKVRGVEVVAEGDS